LIRYDLICEQDHPFDAWFRDSAAFDDQKAKGALACPVCGSQHVEKGLMAPAVSKGHGSLSPDEKAREFGAFLRAVRNHVLENSENVGERFPEEARRIHYEEVEPKKGIYGQASAQEVKALLEEGIAVYPVPIAPEETN
jgi:hypothetical protein